MFISLLFFINYILNLGIKMIRNFSFSLLESITFSIFCMILFSTVFFGKNHGYFDIFIHCKMLMTPRRKKHCISKIIEIKLNFPQAQHDCTLMFTIFNFNLQQHLRFCNSSVYEQCIYIK
jgi:hypothetical protein